MCIRDRYIFLKNSKILENALSGFSYIYHNCKDNKCNNYFSVRYIKGKNLERFLNRFIQKTLFLIEYKNISFYLFNSQVFPRGRNIEIGISGNIDKKQLEYLIENENFHIFFQY